MASQLTGYGLGLLWVGAMALGGLVMLKQKPLPPLPAGVSLASPAKRADQRQNSAVKAGTAEGKAEEKAGPEATPDPQAAYLDALRKAHQRRHAISLFCQFAGTGGIIAGLGLLAVGVMK